MLRKLLSFQLPSLADLFSKIILKFFLHHAKRSIHLWPSQCNKTCLNFKSPKAAAINAQYQVTPGLWSHVMDILQTFAIWRNSKLWLVSCCMVDNNKAFRLFKTEIRVPLLSDQIYLKCTCSNINLTIIATVHNVSLSRYHDILC